MIYVCNLMRSFRDKIIFIQNICYCSKFGDNSEKNNAFICSRITFFCVAFCHGISRYSDANSLKDVKI
jgi:hypothetical protein